MAWVSHAHQRSLSISINPKESKDTTWQAETQFKDPRKTDTFSWLSQGCPSRASALVQVWHSSKRVMGKSSLYHLLGYGGHCLWVWAMLHRTSIRNEPKVQREWFRKSEEEKREVKGQSRVNSCLVSTLAWLCIAPDQCSLSYHLIKFLPNSFLCEGLSVLCSHVCMGIWVPATGVRPWVRSVHVSMVQQLEQVPLRLLVKIKPVKLVSRWSGLGAIGCFSLKKAVSRRDYRKKYI